MSSRDLLLPKEGVRDRLRRVRLTALPILQSGVGAALAWAIAKGLIGHEEPFFAPIAALISLGVGLGQRLTRVVELVIGVALGVLVAEILVELVGSGPVQIAVVVALAMAVAVFLGGGAVVVAQAATSAVLVVALLPPGSPGDPQLDIDRFIDASVGGGVGLLVSLLLLPLNPVTTVRKKFEPLLNKLASLLDESAAALDDRDRAAATRALAEARETQRDVDELQEALEGSAEIARIAPVRWRSRGHLVGYLDAAEPVDHVTRDLRVLARHCVVALRRDEPIPAILPRSLRTLAGSLRLLLFALEDGDVPTDARAAALVAAEDATAALDEALGLAAQTVTVQVRSLATDVLRATGLNRDEILELLPSVPDM